MNIALIRGNTLNKWEMQNFEPLIHRWDIAACGAENGGYPTDSIKMPIYRLKSASATFEKYGLLARAGARIKLWKSPSEYLIGLEQTVEGASILHAAETAIPFSEQAINVKLVQNAKVVLTCWETIPFAYEDDPVVRQRRAYVRKNADLFLATTCRAARALEIEGVSAERIKVIMPGVDITRFAPGRPSTHTLDHYGLAGNEIVMLFIGRLIREKGVRELVVAFAIALRSLPLATAARCRLLIAGTGGQKEFIASLITSLGIATQARIVGGMDYMQIHKLHQIADVFVLPSIATPYWEEQYGMVLAEAMSCGKPVVSTTTGGIPEVVGDAGLLVPPLEPEALAETLRNLIQDESSRAALGHNGRQRAISMFNMNEVAARISAAYSGLIGSALPLGPHIPFGRDLP